MAVRASYWNILIKSPKEPKSMRNPTYLFSCSGNGIDLTESDWGGDSTPQSLSGNVTACPGFVVFPPSFWKQNLWYSARKRCNVSLHFKEGLGVVSNLQDYIARISSHRRPVISVHLDWEFECPIGAWENSKIQTNKTGGQWRDHYNQHTKNQIISELIFSLKLIWDV